MVERVTEDFVIANSIYLSFCINKKKFFNNAMPCVRSRDC